METFRVEVGAQHGVKTGNIVGAIANEAGLEAQYIGRVQIFDDHSIVELPEGIPKDIFHGLKKVWVSGRQLQISKVASSGGHEGKSKTHGDGKAKRP
jgi:ATP-dependent RNA helicase DeaD